jgi:hypothetical protein
MQDKLTTGKYKWRVINKFWAVAETFLFTIKSILPLVSAQSPQQWVRIKGSVILGKMAAA